MGRALALVTALTGLAWGSTGLVHAQSTQPMDGGHPIVFGLSPSAGVTCNSDAVPLESSATNWLAGVLAHCNLPDVVDILVLQYQDISEGDLLNINPKGLFGEYLWHNLHAHGVDQALKELVAVGDGDNEKDFTVVNGVEAATESLGRVPEGRGARLTVSLPFPSLEHPADVAQVVAAAPNAAIVVVTGRGGAVNGARRRRSAALTQKQGDDQEYYYIDNTIWMAIIVAILFTILLAVSVHCLMGVQTPSHFDDPKSKYAIQIGLVEAD